MVSVVDETVNKPVKLAKVEYNESFAVEKTDLILADRHHQITGVGTGIIFPAVVSGLGCERTGNEKRQRECEKNRSHARRLRSKTSHNRRQIASNVGHTKLGFYSSGWMRAIQPS